MKLLVIGLDGATWDLIGPWADSGELPLFKKLRDEGAWGPLRSVTPNLTPPGWTTAFTGVNPGKHGVFDFFSLDPGSEAGTDDDIRFNSQILKITRAAIATNNQTVFHFHNHFMKEHRIYQTAAANYDYLLIHKSSPH